MLLANFAQINRNTAAFIGNAFTNPMALFKATRLPNFYVGDSSVPGETGKSAFNNGYAIGAQGGTAWQLSPKAGGLKGNNLTGTGSLSATSLSMGKDLVSALTGTGGISAASLALIVQLAASATGSGTISTATLKAITNLSAALSGSGSVSAAALSLIVSLNADLSGDGTLSGTLRGTSDLAADITVTGTGLTTANVGAAVWATIIESGYSADEILRLLAAYAAGDATGLNGSASFTGIDGVTTRIQGTVNGVTRVITGLDGG